MHREPSTKVAGLFSAGQADARPDCRAEIDEGGRFGFGLPLHLVDLPILFIAAPKITELRKKFCFRETKKDDF